jgi:hypothetical protein
MWNSVFQTTKWLCTFSMALRSGWHIGKWRIVSSWAFNRSSRTYVLCLSSWVLLEHRVSISTNHHCLDFVLKQQSFHTFLMKTWAVLTNKWRYQSQKWSSGVHLGQKCLKPSLLCNSV